MKADGLLKHAAVAFGIALVLYGTAYTWIEHQRARRGPWRVTFANDRSGAPSILINQPGLAITNVLISFQREPPLTNGSPAELVFSEPRAVPCAMPFGRCVFMDATSLPGTVAFELFGHEIQLLPRVLTIDNQERPWRSNEIIDAN